jgi:glutamate racemase
VAASLQDYLKRHHEIESQLTQGGRRFFYTTDLAPDFNNKATAFFGQQVQAEHVSL